MHKLQTYITSPHKSRQHRPARQTCENVRQASCRQLHRASILIQLNGFLFLHGAKEGRNLLFYIIIEWSVSTPTMAKKDIPELGIKEGDYYHLDKKHNGTEIELYDSKGNVKKVMDSDTGRTIESKTKAALKENDKRKKQLLAALGKGK